MKLNTCYGFIDFSILEKAIKVKLLICDVDGVMSNGFIYINNNGEELKSFNVRDGYGIRCLLKNNIEVAIITGRKTKLLENRAKDLGITHIYQGQCNKLNAFYKLLKKLQLTKEEIAYIGDDLNDLPVITKVGLSVAVADAHPALLFEVDYVTKISGGKGAVRELCDLILLSKNVKNKNYDKIRI
ncbi:3-deoxy-D-manno-octulosonate 8-phosphate phosphatase KdsC [Candidatus Providencia siddallii]|uniref:3-deoxy-D-manno-octulosonate 8-phosphate phosphatase KdsC n=1 Tax=Candidatus Providencia siddallii TaxID=1715285 RepID=A0A0M6W747_9GAMM|nr:3-deoxy-D-manno-octulosonate 8-phosphate phosphatase KdsC [Candidatus Providencia siddallii]